MNTERENIQMKNVLEYLELAQKKYPDKIAIAYEQNRYTYKELTETTCNGGLKEVRVGKFYHSKLCF